MSEESNPVAQDDKWQRFRFVCMGRRYDGDLSVLMAELNSDGTVTKDPMKFRLTKSTRVFRPGATYTMEANESKIRPSTYRYEGMYEDSDKVAAWQATSDAHEAQEAMHRRHKRDTEKHTALLALLKPLREEYSKTIPASGRLALEMSVLRALRYTSDLEGSK